VEFLDASVMDGYAEILRGAIATELGVHLVDV
jgi:hypothetical protein